MALRVIGLALLLGACSPSSPGNDTAPAPRPTQRVVAVSPSASAAQAVAAAYFAALAAKDYARAYRLWSDNGAASGGTLRTFRDSFARFASYRGEAGAPGVIRPSDGQDYILVESSAQTKTAGGPTVLATGVVMLKKPTGTAAPWRIWGVDVRDRHCRADEIARGLGCTLRAAFTKP